MGKLTYLIALWGGCGTVLRKCLQVVQNKVARVVTRCDWSTPPPQILHQIGWLSVNQLVFYHSVLLVFKVKLHQTPKYLNNMYSWSYKYSTRQARSDFVRIEGKPKLALSSESFRWRAGNQFNQLPADIRGQTSLDTFKVKAKSWIKENVSFH